MQSLHQIGFHVDIKVSLESSQRRHPEVRQAKIEMKTVEISFPVTQIRRPDVLHFEIPLTSCLSKQYHKFVCLKSCYYATHSILRCTIHFKFIPSAESAE